MNNIKDISQHFDINFINDKDDKNAIIKLLSNTKKNEKKKKIEKMGMKIIF